VSDHRLPLRDLIAACIGERPTPLERE